ncbi:hypothetical protein [Dyadobacter sp. MSC1_007]|jgi:hypothetical protein|uniref:hypothetical protein n=1 Tax=Dyadobacter sp. MSC1_007 TaxID=2909264 RepID=UPI00202F30FA|nr:hypothetical protein [Dyadobacter sp. MSC1_007]
MIHSARFIAILDACVLYPAPVRDLLLQQFDIEALHPDFFISNLLELNPDLGLSAFKNQVANLRNPPMTAIAVLGKLEKAGLKSTAKALNELLDED